MHIFQHLHMHTPVATGAHRVRLRLPPWLAQGGGDQAVHAYGGQVAAAGVGVHTVRAELDLSSLPLCPG